jgi:hypothetical protein
MASLSRLRRSLLGPMFASALLALQTAAAAAQTKDCEPVADRAGRSLGCFITAREDLGPLPPDTALYWHIYAYPTLAGAKVAAAKTPRGTAVASLGRNWLFTIADARFRSPGGRRVARIGPLPLIEARTFAAVYGVYGRGFSAGHAVAGAPASGRGGVVHARGGAVPRDARGPAGAARGRAGRHGAWRPADAAHRHRHRRAELAGAHPAGRDAASVDARPRLDAERAL